MKKVNEIKIGETYCIDWEGTQRIVNVKSIEKSIKCYIRGEKKWVK